MTLTVKLLLVATLILSIILPFGYYLIGEKNKGRYKPRSASMHFSSSEHLPLP